VGAAAASSARFYRDARQDAAGAARTQIVALGRPARDPPRGLLRA
jgi:hypothetical protein